MNYAPSFVRWQDGTIRQPEQPPRMNDVTCLSAEFSICSERFGEARSLRCRLAYIKAEIKSRKLWNAHAGTARNDAKSKDRSL